MKIGDYARTKDGIILKIKDIEDIYTTDNIYIGLLIYDNEGHFVNDVEIIKSGSIIDLIEVGDYVNGMEVMDADWINENGEYEEGLAFPMYASDDLDVIENWLPLKNVKIKSIVTKEQFSQMEYKIENEVK